ncbi:MAG TPA: sugar ABC transporter substrate-binding protein [Armatimonadota bacterium]|nr:sugar ABC transporter substrate-binding protein [Armatimonadota bacterium]
MKTTYAIALIVLIALSVFAYAIQPRRDLGGKLPLVWTSDDNPARRQQIDLFNAEYPQYSLELDPNNTGMEKVIVQAIAGVGPDLFDCYSHAQLVAYVKAGVACDITDRYEKEGISLDEIWPVVYPNFVHEGKIYGHPTNAATDAIWYNKDVFDACGEPYPEGDWTWEEFIEVAQRLTKRREDGRVEHFGYLSNRAEWYPMIRQFGGQIYSDDGTHCVIDSPEAIQALQLLQDLTYVHDVMPSPNQEAAMAAAGGWGSGTITLFGGGKGAMAHGGRWWLCLMREQYPDLRLGVTEMPHGPKKVFWGYGRATLVNALAPNPDHAWNFIKFEHEEPYNQLVNDQADALAPVISFSQGTKFLHNPSFPKEDYNQTWFDVMEDGVPRESSPFIHGPVADRIINNQLDLLRNKEKTAEEVCRDIQLKTDKAIKKRLREEPKLLPRYEELVAAQAEARIQ